MDRACVVARKHAGRDARAPDDGVGVGGRDAGNVDTVAHTKTAVRCCMPTAIMGSSDGGAGAAVVDGAGAARTHMHAHATHTRARASATTVAERTNRGRRGQHRHQRPGPRPYPPPNSTNQHHGACGHQRALASATSTRVDLAVVVCARGGGNTV